MDNDTRTATGYTEGFTPYAQVPKWVLRDPKLSHGAVRLYGVIMSYADNATRFAFPSRETLAANMGVSVRSIGNYISELEDREMVKVNRRRNKRTGNYYSNSYTLVFQDPTQDSPEETECPRRAETECPLTRPTTLLTKPTSVSPLIPESETTVAPLLPDGTQGHAQTSKGSQADPLGPTWYHSEKRQYILQLIRTTALSKAQHNTDYWDRLYDLGAALEEMFNDDEIIMWLIEDRGWEPPRKAVDKFEAAKWLNELIGTWREELPRLSFPAEGLAA